MDRKVCNVRPRYQRGGKAYPTCGLTCAARLHSQDRQAASSSRKVAYERVNLKVVPIADHTNENPSQPTELLESVETDEDNVGGSEGENVKTFNCIICMETLGVDHIVRFACRHPFCRSCLREHIASELSEHHYPIVCPSCKIEDKATHPSSTLDPFQLRNLFLSYDM